MQRKTSILAMLLLVAGALALAQNASPPSPAQSDATTDAEKRELAMPLTNDPQEIMRRAVEKDVYNWEEAKDYTFLERSQQDALDGNGQVKSSKSETHEIQVLYGEPFSRMVAKDDKP
ncbi:MAG TPA: hypothetical protein VII29_14475, partial [Terriglobales bacterium]